MKIFDDTTPLYLQLREEIEKAIVSLALKADEAIPSIRTLSQQYQLNPQTVSNAISDLLAEGVIYKKRGIGLFVSLEAQEILMKKKSIEFREKEIKGITQKAISLSITMPELCEMIKIEYRLEEDRRVK